MGQPLSDEQEPPPAMPIHFHWEQMLDAHGQPDHAEQRRTASRLLQLRDYLDTHIPPRTVSETLLLATWNIREFDSPRYGARTWESIHYIAEIISRFDIIAIQEVHADLSALRRIKQVLGESWEWVFSDVTEGTRGNQERMAFLFDSRKVRFTGLAGEVVLPPRLSEGDWKPTLQFARTPHLVGFEAGWFRFSLCTVHIYWGTDDANDPMRVEEIRSLSQFLAERAASTDANHRHLILLGDFNIFQTNNDTFREIINAGFNVPEALQALPSNVAQQRRHYDQIALYGGHRTRLTRPDACGVLNYFERLYLDCDEQEYAEAMNRYEQRYDSSSSGAPRDAAQRSRYYRTWRTFQMSDHLPMWVELQVDFSEELLREKLSTVGGPR